MKTTLTAESIQTTIDQLSSANLAFNASFPGESDARQPVQTVYGGAQLFKASSVGRMGQVALRALEAYAPDAQSFAAALGLPDRDDLRQTIYARVTEKLAAEPIEDFRIDFEDGYGNRPDDEEDRDAVRTAEEVADGIQKGSLPPFIGIRLKPFTEELRARSIRTLDLFVTTLVERAAGLPANFVVTLPKVTIPEQVTALVRLFEILEQKTALDDGALKLEIMVETPQSIIGSDGRIALPALVRAAEGRCIAAHFGVYDYTASANITAAYQDMDHPSCDFARHMMQTALGGTGVALSDGATNIMPVGPHRAAKQGPPLTEAQEKENREVVHRAWKLCYRHIRHSLRHGFYQGWDLHPSQFPVRYAAVYVFFLESLDAASLRLKTFMERAAQATLVGDVFDDAATGQALLNFFLRGINCGAITEHEASMTGLSMDEIRTRSFNKILQGRRGEAR